MGFLKDLYNSFSNKISPGSSGRDFFGDTIEAMFAFLTSKITSSNQAYATIVYINNYLKLKSNERLERLPESYLFVEKYLTDIDPDFNQSKENLRAQIKVQYANLLSVPGFEIIFEEESKQEFELCKLFLKLVINGLQDLLGQKGGEEIQNIGKYLDDIPNGFPSQNPLNDHTFNPSNYNDWVQFLRRLSFHSFNILTEKLGEEAALRRFDNGYKQVAKKFINLDTFQIIISVLPENLMDEDRVGALTKHQIEKLLLKKADHFEQLTKDLQEKNKELERTQRLLIEAKNKAEDATRAKAMFLANMSHEIRTPMNAVIGMTEILRETSPSKEQLLYIDTIYKSGYDLIHIINDILDYSKIESGSLQLEQQPVNLHNLTADLGNLLILKAEEKNIELVFYVDEKVPDYIIGDAVRLKQILTNLLGNAIKFTEVGEVVLEIHAENISPNSVKLEFLVRDTGIGIPQNKIDHIFDSFSQVDASTTRNYGGTGLGLTITKSLVSMMNGEIWVNSVVGEGTNFTFTMAVDVDVTKTRTSVDNQMFVGKTALVAGQNNTQREMLAKKLKAFGFKTVTFSTLPELILGIQETPASHLVIAEEYLYKSIDQSLKNSFKMQLEAKNLPLISIIPFSSSANHLDDKESLSITKPIRRDVLIKKINRAFSVDQSVPEPLADETTHKVRSINILLAEDNPTNQMVAKGLMRNIGYEIDVVSNGQQVLEYLDRKFYDLVLMDVQMPVLDGLQATQKVRMKVIAPHQPIIIAMTANASEEDRQVCLFAGMNDYLSKPVTRSEIIQKIENWFPES
ncbi:MAG: response regulator [Balneolaceae bacterium]|nr:response regulator [Balneolaceae bacterium]